MDRNAPGRADRHGRERLCRQQGADRALARQGPAALRDHAALRRDLDAGADGGRRPARRRASRLPRPDPYQREPRRDRLRQRALSGAPATMPASTSITACSGQQPDRPLHPHDRPGMAPLSPRPARSRCSARPRTCFSAPACSTGPARGARASASRSPPISAAAPPIRCCGRWRRPTRCCSCRGRRSRPSPPCMRSRAAMRVALGLDHLIGSFEPGREADLVVLDTARDARHGAPAGDGARSRRGAVRAGHARRRAQCRRDLCDGAARRAARRRPEPLSPARRPCGRSRDRSRAGGAQPGPARRYGWCARRSRPPASPGWSRR